MNEHPVWPYVAAQEGRFRALSDKVWATPETCYGEHASAAAHAEELAHQGFRTEMGVAGIPTALMAEWGEGGPVIAFLGEYDALAALSQEADVAEPRPLVEGGNGHGCGHNMLGAAAMQAATALRDWLREAGLPGRVRYYGCPAEEGGSAKTFMVRDGLFDDVDVAITWHPGALAHVLRGSSLAAARVDYHFTGRASHAAASPHLGRSALDAVELMNVGVNYLREHMSDAARVHYAYIDAGGEAPNVVQARAHVRYVVREPSAREMMKLIARVDNVARGAALMTDTKVDIRLVTAASELLPNTPLCDAMARNLDLLGPPPFNTEDQAYAAKMQATMSTDDIAATYAMAGMAPLEGKVLPDFLLPEGTPPVDIPGSTDVADVSWVVPTAQLWGGNYAIGTPFHSWQMVAQGKSASALRGMLHAAQVMAMTGWDAMTSEALRKAAREDLTRRQGAEGYACPLPEGAEPPIEEMAG